MRIEVEGTEYHVDEFLKEYDERMYEVNENPWKDALEETKEGCTCNLYAMGTGGDFDEFEVKKLS